MTYQYREFFTFLVASEQIGTGKKFQSRSRKNLVPEKSIGTGIKHMAFSSQPLHEHKFGSHSNTVTVYTDSQEPLQLLNFTNFSEMDSNGSYIFMSKLWQPPIFHDDQHLRDRVFPLSDEDFGCILYNLS